MSAAELEIAIEKYSDNPEAVAELQGEQARRSKEEEQALLALEFQSRLEELIQLPRPPEEIKNLFLSYQEVEVGEPEEVDVTKIGDDGKPFLAKELRRAKVMQWVVAPNHICYLKTKSGTKTTTNGTKAAGQGKRTIHVWKREGGGEEAKLKDLGEFASGKNACDKAGLLVGGNSAIRVLRDSGYIVEYVNIE